MPLDPVLDAWLADPSSAEAAPPTDAPADSSPPAPERADPRAAPETHLLSTNASDSGGEGYHVDPAALKAPANSARSIAGEIRALITNMVAESTVPEMFLYGYTTAEMIKTLGQEWHDWFTAFAAEFDALAAKVDAAAGAYSNTEAVNTQQVSGQVQP